MNFVEVRLVLDALERYGVQYWVEGGWGVDALVGHQTREHRDVDIDVSHVDEQRVIGILSELGYAIETDWRPNRVELVAPRRCWVDLHPLLIDEVGVRQASLDGGWHHFPDRCFISGSIDGVEVPCFTAEAQRFFHTGYELRDVDLHDLAQLDRLV